VSQFLKSDTCQLTQLEINGPSDFGGGNSQHMTSLLRSNEVLSAMKLKTFGLFMAHLLVKNYKEHLTFAAALASSGGFSSDQSGIMQHYISIDVRL
jgi:hypothetical protein